MLLQLLVTGVLVKSAPGTGLNVAFLEGDTVAKDYWNLQCLAPAVGETCKNNTGSNNPNYPKKLFLLLLRGECLPEYPVFSSRYFCCMKRGRDRLLLT